MNERTQNEQKIKMNAVNLTAQKPLYFVDYSYNLPSIVKKGQWSADLICQKKMNERLTFKVDDYMEPLYSITIDVPPVYLCSSKQIDLKLNVTYTYGKPVNGYVAFKFAVSTKHEPYILKQTTNVSCFTNGYFHKLIELSEEICSNLSSARHYNVNNNEGASLIVEAFVTDLATNRKDFIRKSGTKIMQYPYRIVDRFTKNFYRPRMANYYIVGIGQPATFSLSI